MEQNVLQFNRKEKLIDLGKMYGERGDLMSSLSFYLDALRENESKENLEFVANTYAEMNLFDLSNKYWFKYLNICDDIEKTKAIEQRGINYFYLDNLWASGYYFHEKISKDGIISQDILDEDLLSFLSQERNDKSLYRIAYPFDRADYSFIIKRAKSTLASGNYILAKKIYADIPKECMSEDELGDMCVANIVAEDYKEAIDVCKYSLSKYGDNLTAFCNLSNIYKIKNDEEKSLYYYCKALNNRKNVQDEYYKLASTAVEQGDDQVVKECIEYILADHPYDNHLRYFYAIALANLGDFENSYKAFSYALRINPNDFICEYYAKLIDKIKIGNKNAQKFLPLRYDKDLPISVVTKITKKINEISFDPALIKPFLKKKEGRDAIRYGLYSQNSNLIKSCIYILSCSQSDFATDKLLDIVLDPDVSSEVKSSAIRAIILFDKVKTQFSIVCGNVFLNIKMRALCFREKENSEVFLAGYAKAMSVLPFLGVNKFDVVSLNMNKIYKKLHSLPIAGRLTSDEIASLCVHLCKYAGISDIKNVCSFFSIKEGRLKTLIEVYNGENNKESK